MPTTNPVRYKTKPLDCWQKAKELRLTHYREVANARAEGKLVVTGSANTFMSLLAGFGDFVFFSGEPYGASIGYDSTFSAPCSEAAEAQGWSRDMCSYMRNYWGSMILDKYYFGGPFPKPDFCYTRHICDSHAKWFQVVADYYNVPLIGIDLVPYNYMVGGERFQKLVEYGAQQAADSIEKIEKITGRKFDDEKFLIALKNEFRTTALWGEVSLMNSAIPAPLDMKSIYSLYILPFFMKHEKRAVDFFEGLKAEVQDRIDNKIAAVASERGRIMHDSQPPWFFLRLYRYLEKYGVVCVGSHYTISLTGTWEMGPNGTCVPKKTPWERGINIKTRDDGLRALAEWYLDWPMNSQFVPEMRTGQLIALAKHWKVDGVMMHLNRGCEGMCAGCMENRLGLNAVGIPTMLYEGNMADEREFDEAQVMDRMEAFLENMGFSKLEE
ncbi:MAG: benzoyl-CoA reductase, bzd-type, subunit O [Dehalococcoidia bacterium]|nr:benzoyl-CoA reductase, bzd-type, subunit O [Dehalococcoidia bacterium]